MAFIKYSDGAIKKIISEPISSEELAEKAQIEKEASSKEDKPVKPKWAE